MFVARFFIRRFAGTSNFRFDRGDTESTMGNFTMK